MSGQRCQSCDYDLYECVCGESPNYSALDAELVAARKRIEQAKGELIKLAAVMVGSGAISQHRDDWPERLRWADAHSRAVAANDRVARWAMRLRKIANSL